MITVIIPSKTWVNLHKCVEAISQMEPLIKILVVDDGLDLIHERRLWLYERNSSILEGKKPFVYSRNCNTGISHCSGDVVLLNDDAILKTKSGFCLLQRSIMEHPEYGLVSATTNLAGNPQQRPKGIGLREANRVVAFVCVYIPRTTIETVGLLDERFTAYGFEDNDYCRRVRNAGLKLGVHDGCYVDHGLLRSTFRGDPKAPADIRPGAAIYRAKWGDLN